jgi:hypothetical protein
MAKKAIRLLLLDANRDHTEALTRRRQRLSTLPRPFELGSKGLRPALSRSKQASLLPGDEHQNQAESDHR